MPTNLAIDDELLEEALRIGGHRTKRATVTEALEAYIMRRRQAIRPCGPSLRYDVPIFTADKDFSNYGPILGVRLHAWGVR